MQNLTAQHLALFEEFSETEVTFNAQVIIESGLIPSDVRLTIGSQHLDCVLYACSMKAAHIIVEVGKDPNEFLAHGNAGALLRLGFKQRDEKAAASFFVACRVESLPEYDAQKPHVRFATLKFTQKPPDALIGILGSLLEMIKAHALCRRYQRIVLTPENMKKIGLESRESCLVIDGSSRRCLVRDLSFGGAKVLLSMGGLPQAPLKVLLKLQKCEIRDDEVIDGSIVRVENVQEHEHLVALSIQYSTDPPISYKRKINLLFALAGTPPDGGIATNR